MIVLYGHWKIVAYNGTEFQLNRNANLMTVVDQFLKETGLNQLDIKSIVRLD